MSEITEELNIENTIKTDIENNEDLIFKKIENIVSNIKDIAEINEVYGSLLTEGLMLSMNLIEEYQLGNLDRKDLDVSKHIEIVNRILGISLQDVVIRIIEDNNKNNEISSKEADKDTLEFITSNLDDYEKFLAKTKASDDLAFLSKSI